MYGASAVAASYSAYKIHKENDDKKAPVMGVMGAFVFAAQMINFTIPGTGSSGHLCGGMLLSAILGPYAGFLTMIGILFIQCLLFADGGILALGCNIWNMAFYGCFIGSLVIWNLMTRKNMTRGRIIAASIIGSVVTLQMGAFSVVIETLCSGVTDLPFSVFAATMQPIHLAIGFVEGLITAAVLVFIFEARPELLWHTDKSESTVKDSRMTLKKTLIILAAVTLVTGGIVSLFASSNPDGLEWSIEKITGNTELEEYSTDSAIYDKAEVVQTATSLLPDYSIKNSEGTSLETAGTSLSGIIGCLVVFALCFAVYMISRIKKNSVKAQ